MTTLTDSINQFEDYRLEEKALTLIEPCFCITLFTNETVTKEHAPESLLTPYRIFLEDFGDQTGWILYDGNQSDGVKITAKNRQVPDEWLANPKSRVKNNTIVDLYSGVNKRERRLPRLEWEYDKANPELNRPSRSYYRLALPLSWLAAQGIKGGEAYLARITGDYPLSWGYAGLALNYDAGEVVCRKDLLGYIGSWIERHPGIMSPNPRIEALWSSTISGLTGIGWITLLGLDYCQRMGGVAALAQKMASLSGVEVTPFNERGAMLRIGDAPLLGDVMKNDSLDSYRDVGQVLQPLHQISERLATDYLHVRGIEDEDAGKKWFNRFFVSKEEN